MSYSQPATLIQERLQGLLTRATTMLEGEAELTADVLATLRNVAAAVLQEVDTFSAAPSLTLEAVPVGYRYTATGMGRG